MEVERGLAAMCQQEACEECQAQQETGPGPHQPAEIRLLGDLLSHVGERTPGVQTGPLEAVVRLLDSPVPGA